MKPCGHDNQQRYVKYLICTIGNYTSSNLAEHLDDVSHDVIIASLRERGIYTVFHYLPLHLSDMGRKLGGQPGDCPVTERVSDQLVRLPFYNNLSSSELEQVLDAISDFKF